MCITRLAVSRRGLDMCPQTQTRLTSSKLEPDPELKLRVLAWLKVPNQYKRC